MTNSITLGAMNSTDTRPACPKWCDPASCETGGRDTHHRGAPIHLETADAHWEVQLYRMDDHNYPETWERSPELLVHCESKFLTGGGSSPMYVLTYVKQNEVPQLLAAIVQATAASW